VPAAADAAKLRPLRHLRIQSSRILSINQIFASTSSSSLADGPAALRQDSGHVLANSPWLQSPVTEAAHVRLTLEVHSTATQRLRATQQT